jgi:hypothetical protein
MSEPKRFEDFWLFKAQCPRHLNDYCMIYGKCNEENCAILFWLEKTGLIKVVK